MVVTSCTKSNGIMSPGMTAPINYNFSSNVTGLTEPQPLKITKYASLQEKLPTKFMNLPNVFTNSYLPVPFLKPVSPKMEQLSDVPSPPDSGMLTLVTILYTSLYVRIYCDLIISQKT